MLATLLVAACRDNTAATAVPVASVVITASRAELVVGETHDFDAIARSAVGDLLSDRVIVWRSDDPDIATISATGILLARRSGVVDIIASSEGREARLQIRVIAPSPIPALHGVAPERSEVGRRTPLIVQLLGAGLTAQSTALWNGEVRQTEFVSSTELRMTVTPNDLAASGASAITVHTPAPGGGTSAALIFTVALPVPTITGLSPQRIVMGWGLPLSVTVSGTGFTAATRLFVEDQLRGIDQRTSTAITFRLEPAELRTARTMAIRVENEAPGGGSAHTTFEVQSIPVASVTIDAPSGVLWTWARLRLAVSGMVRSATQTPLPEKVLQWSVADPAVAQVIPDAPQLANVWGNAAGMTTIRATVEGVSGEAMLRVYDTPDFDVLYAGGVAGDRYISRWPVGTGNAPFRIRLGMQAMYPAPAPDGRQFAYAGFSEAFPVTEIYVANVNGSAIRQLTSDNGTDLYPDWSPDGTRLAWVSSRTGQLNVFTMKTDGTDVQQLTFARLIDPPPGSGQTATRPAWSPDGRHIAYTVGVNGRSELWVMNADGSGKRRLAADDSADDFEPTWSSDGRTIAVRRVRPLPAGTYLARVDVASGREVYSLVVPTIREAATPSWSPDGRWMLMGSSVTGDAPVLHAIPMTEVDARSRMVLPSFWIGGVRDARWIRRAPTAAP